MHHMLGNQTVPNLALTEPIGSGLGVPRGRKSRLGRIRFDFEEIDKDAQEPLLSCITLFTQYQPPTTMPKNLVVFDFDWSFVDQDTDRWVFEVLDTSLRRKLQQRKTAGSQCTPDVV